MLQQASEVLRNTDKPHESIYNLEHRQEQATHRQFDQRKFERLFIQF